MRIAGYHNIKPYAVRLMPDDASLTPANDFAVIDNLSRCVCEAFVAVGQQHPEWLRHDFIHAQWNDEQFDLIKERILDAELTFASDTDALIQQVRKFLEFFLLPTFLETTEFTELAEKLRQIVQDKASHYKEIAILLLDAENLKLDTETENFLQTICKYPILVKTAFAHWTSTAMRGQDINFHSRNYQLIHVPPGENSADLQMTAHGSSILRFYSNTKEVLVCSSDQGLLHLSNVLHTQGLTVYQVSRKGQIISVLNKRTGDITTWVIPITLERFILQIKTIIKEDNKRSANQWMKLSKISQIYQKKYSLTFTDAVSNYSNCQSAIEFFTNNPYHFAIHQLPEKPELYVSLFNSLLPQTASTQKTPNLINSPAALEKALVKLLTSLTVESLGSYIEIAKLESEFSTEYDRTVTQTIEELQLKVNLQQFLESSASFKLEQINGTWQVALANS